MLDARGKSAARPGLGRSRLLALGQKDAESTAIVSPVRSMPFVSRHRCLISLFLAGLLLSCSDAPTAPGRSPVASIELRPQTATVTVGGTEAFVATPLGAQGQPLGGRAIFWASEDETIATVSASGVVSGLKAGSTRIAASSEGRSAYAQVEVSPRRVHTVSVVPPSPETTVNGTVRLRAIAYDSTGAELTGRTFVWATSNELNATVVQGPTPDSATVTGRGVGSAMITATSEARTGSAAVTVSAIPVASVTVSSPVPPLLPGQTHQLTATVRDAGNNILNRQVTWSTESASVAVVNSAGLVTAVSAGVTTITASVEGVNGTVNVQVIQAAVNSVSLTAPRTGIRVGEEVQVTAVLRDAANNVLTGRPIAWSSSNGNVATVSGTGLVTAAGPGSAIITATSEDKSGTITFSVTVVPVISVSVSPASAERFVGQTQTFTATPRDSIGGALTGRTVVWGSSPSSVATINASDGQATAVAPGSATITATVEGVAGTASLTVQAVPVASVEVSPSAATIFVGGTQALSAVARDAGGNILTGRTVSWSSNASGVASVNATTGVVTGVSAGPATITATVEGVNGTAAITVQQVPVNSVVVTPASAGLHVTRTLQFSAEPRDAGGNPLAGRTVVWGSNDESVASVDVSGLVTAHAVGSTSIWARSEGVDGVASVTVTLAPVASVVLAPAATTIEVDEQLSYGIEVRDIYGALVTGRTVTWMSSDENVATVDSGGVATGVAAGTATITATVEGESGDAVLTVEEPDEEAK
jgi:trimeric autotransporter adhesin